MAGSTAVRDWLLKAINMQSINVIAHQMKIQFIKADIYQCTLEGSNGVNYTAGLPIVRTSPDHGTAFEIAGEGKASEKSFRNALFLAVEIYQNRKEYKELNENTLQVSKKR